MRKGWWACPACHSPLLWKVEGKELAEDHECFELGIDPIFVVPMPTEEDIKRGIVEAAGRVDDLLRASSADPHVSQALRADLALAAVGGYAGADTDALSAIHRS